jgi:hypothetical protein
VGAITAKIGPTSDVDEIFSKMYSQYVFFYFKLKMSIAGYKHLSFNLNEGPTIYFTLEA